MSFAIPDRIVDQGSAHPLVLRSADALRGLAGWRVTSVYRPDADTSPTHYAGRAIDVAPLRYQRGGLGLPQCRIIADFLTRTVPEAAFDVIAEDDHIHLTFRGESARAGSNAIGLYTPNGVIMSIQTALANPNPHMIQPASKFALGPIEYGDAYGDPDEMGDSEYGDPEIYQVNPDNTETGTGDPVLVEAELEAGDAEMGGPRKRRRLVRGRKKHKAGRAPRKLKAGSSKSAAYYEGYVGIQQRISGPVPPGTRMRRAECAALSAAILLNRAFTPVVFPFTVVGANLEIDIDSTLNSVLGAAVPFDWTGDITNIYVALLSATPAVFTVSRTIGSSVTSYNLQLEALKNGATLYQINSNVFAAMPRITNGRLVTAAVPSGNFRVVLSGLPVANFSASMQHFIPGDSSAESVLKSLGAL